MFGPCFYIQLCPFSYAIILMGKRQSWLLYLNYLPGVLWRSVLCGPSSRYRLVCDSGIS